eukprot:Lankesteria_metandrocarpae@DN1310_c0_g1_i1.p1
MSLATIKRQPSLQSAVAQLLTTPSASSRFAVKSTQCCFSKRRPRRDLDTRVVPKCHSLKFVQPLQSQNHAVVLNRTSNLLLCGGKRFASTSASGSGSTSCGSGSVENNANSEQVIGSGTIRTSTQSLQLIITFWYRATLYSLFFAAHCHCIW